MDYHDPRVVLSREHHNGHITNGIAAHLNKHETNMVNRGGQQGRNNGFPTLID